MVILLKALKPIDEEFIEAISSRIMSMTFEDSDEGKDFLKIELDNEDITLLDIPLFLDATAFSIQWGDLDNLTPLRKINIKKISGFLKLTVEGTGDLWKQDQVAIKRLWAEQEISEIVRTLAKEMGFSQPDIQVPEEYIFCTFQQYEPNSQFLARLSREVGYAFWVDNNFHWKARDTKGNPTIKLVFRGAAVAGMPGAIIGEPTVKYEFTREQPQQVIGAAVVDKTKAAGPANSSGLSATALTALRSVTGKPKNKISMSGYGNLHYSSDIEKKATTFGEKKELPAKRTDTVYTPTGKPQKAAGAWRGKQNTSSIELKIRGLGCLGVGEVVELANFGAINDGKWYIRKIKHEITSDGFIQSLTLSRSSSKISAKGKAGASVKGKVNQASADLSGPPLPQFKFEKVTITDEYGNLKEITRKSPVKPDGVTKQFLEKWGGYP